MINFRLYYLIFFQSFMAKFSRPVYNTLSGLSGWNRDVCILQHVRSNQIRVDSGVRSGMSNNSSSDMYFQYFSSIMASFNKCAVSWENQQCGFRTGLTQTGLYKHRKELEA